MCGFCIVSTDIHFEHEMGSHTYFHSFVLFIISYAGCCWKSVCQEAVFGAFLCFLSFKRVGTLYHSTLLSGRLVVSSR